MGQNSESLFDLKWNNFSAHLTDLSMSLLQDTSLFDISIQCGTEVVKAHKLVLSSCSTWFKEVINNMQSSPSPLVVLWETNMADMKSILSFMYNGQVQVEHDSLLSFLKLAGYLQVKGLTEADKNNLTEEPYDKAPGKGDDNFKKKSLKDGLAQSDELKRRNDENSMPNSSRASSRDLGKIVYRKDPSETRLTKEDFDLLDFKKQTEDRPSSVDKPAVGRSDFEIKSDYERAKVREMRLKEVMKNAGKDIKGVEMPGKRKHDVKKDSLREQLRAFQHSKSYPDKSKQSTNNTNEESLLEAMLERRNKPGNPNNSSLSSRFETSSQETETDYSSDFDPSLLVKTEIDETMEEEVLNTSEPIPPPFSHAPAPPGSLQPNVINNGLMCTICKKGPYMKGKLSTHMKNVHSEVEYECTTCVKTFKCERYLLNHKKQYCPDRFK